MVAIYLERLTALNLDCYLDLAVCYIALEEVAAADSNRLETEAVVGYLNSCC